MVGGGGSVLLVSGAFENFEWMERMVKVLIGWLMVLF